ncbi:MAG: GGDEF domain-containing protein, partial [Deltaproteobacteria bacterium]|nr:GGDEF domain-containing protein [Deltaproteobacteria bacterium]
NRRYFDEMLSMEWRRAIRIGAPLSLMMIDVDDFKAYNDHYGHAGGDAVLRNVAGVLREALEVRAQVLRDVVRVALELGEVERRVVVKSLTGDFVELGVKGIAGELTALGAGEFRKHGWLGCAEHTIEASQYRHGQHHPLVLRRPVGPAKQVCDLPDEVSEGVVIGHRVVSRFGCGPR